ncbi:hypothetical protein HDK77DRAFT_232936 [Phyllosticta capitalensis]|uniref:Uncharacterized protein n=1 Tax=Phyllosticta capitalensis TaxID=121624 RepID=A0ABR1YNG4_9PEZI
MKLSYCEAILLSSVSSLNLMTSSSFLHPMFSPFLLHTCPSFFFLLPMYVLGLRLTSLISHVYPHIWCLQTRPSAYTTPTHENDGRRASRDPLINRFPISRRPMIKMRPRIKHVGDAS